MIPTHTGTLGSVALHAHLGTLSQVMDGLRRLPHGIAQELQEQRRQAVRSLGVVGPGPRILESCPFLRRGQVQSQSNV
jgi:hypothetical protein